MVYIAIAKLFPSAGKRDAVLDALKPEFKHVYDNEKDFCPAYFFYNTVEGEDIIGIELYNTKDDLFNKHMKSGPFEKFVEESTPLVRSPFTLGNYEPANVGFLARPGYGQKFVKDSKILAIEFTLKPGTRDRFLEDGKALVENVFKTEPNCFGYYFMKSLDSPDKVAIFERYKTLEDIEVTHVNSDTFKKIFGAFEADKIITEQSVVICTDSGVGFLDRS
ncbi:uncharacterized protein V2V93DRAFT_364676 [Kockiozyma suomiensis]|uniref:uncharacterized protein n=1 Tax=Kockiozyma suomiensis TaxID=1337062 RepID=UPI003343C3A7